jgi:aconitate hydratase
MGILPLEFSRGQSAATLGLNGEEVFSIEGVRDAVESQFVGGRTLRVRATRGEASFAFEVICRIDTPQELQYFRHGGILLYVLRQLLRSE